MSCAKYNPNVTVFLCTKVSRRIYYKYTKPLSPKVGKLSLTLKRTRDEVNSNWKYSTYIKVLTFYDFFMAKANDVFRKDSLSNHSKLSFLNYLSSILI